MSTQDEAMPLNFDECCNQMLEFGYEVSPSELHGLLSGVVCTGLKIRPDSIINLVMKHVDVETCSERNRETVLTMYAFIEREMFSADSRYTLFLPDDELDMTQRVRSLAAWCQGYLVGFGTGSAQIQNNKFSPETEEALKDIVNISNLSDEFGDEDEVNEVAYAELVEYLKVAVLLMSSEMLASTKKDS
jgi:yecA family protein